MSITPIHDPLPGERVLAISPASAEEAQLVWRRRPHAFAGRAMTAGALAQAQIWAAGHLARRAQDWLPGVVAGLEVQWLAEERVGDGQSLLISAGRALAVNGEDVILQAPLSCRLADVPVLAPAGFFVDGSGVEAGSEGVSSTPRPRVLGRTPDPVTGISQVATLGALPAAARATLPALGVLVLQPVLVDSADFDPMDPCEPAACSQGSGSAVSFEDWRVADGARLVWYVWPGEWLAVAAVGAAQLRNAMAWKIFETEATLAAEQCLPWETFGQPLALAHIDPAALQVQWLDRASVVRQGGRARDARLVGSSASGLHADARAPARWQAQIEQLAEQIASGGEPAPAADTLADAFARALPPVGLLPKNAFDGIRYRSGFFPSDFDVDAVPVPIEQLDIAVRANAPLAPLKPGQAESVRILVPVALQSWEPRLLHVEQVAPIFQATLDENLLRRSRFLGFRQGLRKKLAMLSHAADGQTHDIADFKNDPAALEPESLSPWGEPPPGGGHRGLLMAGMHQHFFDSANPPFTLQAGEALFVWVCLDPDHPPRSLMLQWHSAAGWEHRAYWGEDLLRFGAPGPAYLRMGDLPTLGQWVMLKINASLVGVVGANAVLDGMAFTLYDGRAAFGLAGARTDRVWRKWFCNFLPAGARVQGNEGWDLLTANDLWAPFEPHGGVEPSLPVLDAGSGGDIFGNPAPAGGAAAGQLQVPQSGFNIHYPPAPGWRGHTLVPTGGVPLVSMTTPVEDRLSSWVYLDELTPPRALWCLLSTRQTLSTGAVKVELRSFFWGENRMPELTKALPILARLDLRPQRAGALPLSGAWVDLTLPALATAAAPGAPAVTSVEVLGLLFAAFDGDLAFSDLRLRPGAAAAAPQLLWPAQINGLATVPPYLAFLNAKLQAQHNLGVLTPTPSSRIGTVRVYTELAADPLIRTLSDHEQSQLLLRGVAGFADYLRQRIDRADDITDFGFAHMQVDMHRIRQLTMSTTDASRLAISPTLAAIAKSDSAIAVQSQIRDYITAVKAPPARAQLSRASLSAAALNATAFSSQTAAVASTFKASQTAFTQAKLITPPRAPRDIIYASPVIGLSEIRTTAIAERLRTPPSPEARDYALSNRQRTLASLVDLLDQFMREDSGAVPALFEGFEVPGLAGDPFLVGSANPQKRPLFDFFGNTALLAEAGKPPPLTASAIDEATLFTQAVALSDITIAMLRQLEARLSRYRDALARCDGALQTLQDQTRAIDGRLRAGEDELAEARHDVSVARALLAEESERIVAINVRRRRVLDEEVKFVAYVRPRETDNLLATPTHGVDPGLLEAPVPACLRQHPDVPDELADMLRVVREAPANWFVRLPVLIGKLDRIEHLHGLLQSSQNRAKAGIAQPQLVVRSGAGTALGAAAARVAGRQIEALAPRLAAVQALPLASLAQLNWQGLQLHAHAVVSFADLAEGGHGRSEVSRQAAQELQDLRSITACLHAEFTGVGAALRLQWAETLSAFDDAPSLRNLASLPGWGGLPYVDRRQMQSYVDWLFSSIEPGQPQAVGLINDVVRMCLLLASHAPVDRIISGRMARPITGVAPGLRIPLTVLDGRALRIGMSALIYRQDVLVARALVEDLGAAEVSARVVHTSAARVDLGEDVRVHFGDAAMSTLQGGQLKRSLFAK